MKSGRLTQTPHRSFCITGCCGWANDKAIGYTVRIGNSQDLKAPPGKVLRIDMNWGDPYPVPKDNPFVGNTEALPEIWAYVLRNPCSLSFDAAGEHQSFASFPSSLGDAARR